MRSIPYRRLCALARRESRGHDGAEDLVQEALLAAVLAGRHDLAVPGNSRWLTGVVRNQARMAARSAVRRRHREQDWQVQLAPAQAEAQCLAELLDGLPRSLRSLAALVLSGHNRREIAYLLHLPDTALRQRVSALRRRMTEAGYVAPNDLPGLNLDLHYGQIRDALLPKLILHGGAFASHDPDGHLFVVARSQSGLPRQQAVHKTKEGSP